MHACMHRVAFETHESKREGSVRNELKKNNNKNTQKKAETREEGEISRRLEEGKVIYDRTLCVFSCRSGIAALYVWTHINVRIYALAV